MSGIALSIAILYFINYAPCNDDEYLPIVFLLLSLILGICAIGYALIRYLTKRCCPNCNSSIVADFHDLYMCAECYLLFTDKNTQQVAEPDRKHVAQGGGIGKVD